ncbi:hypothetical protein, partial [Bacteroides gallinaceum]|uniref:hypothetical protein n=1 Tax=Bacteroides gallinaceum TaxID=1462571 RepID=UPI0019576913
MDIEARLLQIPNRQLLHHGTCTDEILFQMNFRRSQIIFPWCKVMEQLPLFSESVGGRFANTGSAYLRQNLPFSDTHK